MHPLEAPKSVAAEVDAKIDPKNDQKMLPRWGQNLVKNRFQDGFGNEVHLGPVLGPSWGRLGTVFGPFLSKKYKTWCVFISLCSEMIKTHHVFIFFVVRFS